MSFLKEAEIYIIYRNTGFPLSPLSQGCEWQNRNRNTGFPLSREGQIKGTGFQFSPLPVFTRAGFVGTGMTIKYWIPVFTGMTKEIGITKKIRITKERTGFPFTWEWQKI